MKKINNTDELIEAIKSGENETIEENHKFNGGIYIRTIYPKAGTVVVGKIHKYAGFNILLKGKITVHDGEKVLEIEAPHTWANKADSQKVLMFHEDSEFSSVVTSFSDNPTDAEAELCYPDTMTLSEVKKIKKV